MNITRAAQRSRLRLIIAALVMALAAVIIPLTQTASAHTATHAAAGGGPSFTSTTRNGCGDAAGSTTPSPF